jgi:hypothetical protein
VAQTLGAIVGKQLYRRVAEFAATLIGIGLAALLYAGSVAAVYPRFSRRADPAVSRFQLTLGLLHVRSGGRRRRRCSGIAGGLLFDRPMAGWDVSVVLDAAQPADEGFFLDGLTVTRACRR